MPDAPRFSVTIPAYNAEATLAETVGSVLAQTFTDFEVVIVDDGSTDGTRALAESLAAVDSRIRVISQENRGSGGAYNTAIRNARADLIVMLSADDLLVPEHLSAFDPFIAENPEASVFTSGGWYEYEDGTREHSTLHERWANRQECTLNDLLSACFFGIGAVFRREVFDKLGGFDEDIYAEDYVFWLLAMANGFSHRFLNRPLAIHRRNSVQKSADALRMRRADVRAVREVMETGLLSPREISTAKRVIRRHLANIAIRLTLGALLGNDGATRLIDRLRSRHHPSQEA
ncbi:MAG: glycosyltransferase [Actinomycetota bacterium]|nr:MAG: glycosyl transferase family [Actinomycetota bacterium]MDO8950815.1 glycosyltransferase [Actinomycetota bacterium]MDP3629929.1 glycosyltransferase [Actinomycetota bacterium]